MTMLVSFYCRWSILEGSALYEPILWIEIKFIVVHRNKYWVVRRYRVNWECNIGSMKKMRENKKNLCHHFADDFADGGLKLKEKVVNQLTICLANQSRDKHANWKCLAEFLPFGLALRECPCLQKKLLTRWDHESSRISRNPVDEMPHHGERPRWDGQRDVKWYFDYFDLQSPVLNKNEAYQLSFEVGSYYMLQPNMLCIHGSFITAIKIKTKIILGKSIKKKEIHLSEANIWNFCCEHISISKTWGEHCLWGKACEHRSCWAVVSDTAETSTGLMTERGHRWASWLVKKKGVMRCCQHSASNPFVYLVRVRPAKKNLKWKLHHLVG